jgi:hypothetical protein
MPITIEVLDKVPEANLIESIIISSDDGAKIITAINDKQGTFTLESTFPDEGDGGGGGAGGAIAFEGKMSTFGGPHDPGVSPTEGLSLFDPADVENNDDLFLPQQPPNTTGLARRLNPDAKYLACRWDFKTTPRNFLKAKTTKVKVTNPANGTSANARPADWGPAVWTGRVADLSPGLAHELGLATNAKCQVEVTLPGGAPIPSLGTGVATNVNLAAIDVTIFPPDMTRTLVVMTTSNNTTYWVVNQVGPNEGGQTLLRHAGNQTDILLSDTTVFPVKASDQIPAAVAAELNKAAPELVASEEEPVGNPPQPGDDINAKMFQAAKDFVDQDTSHVPDTGGGNLACAWAVNEVTRRALGKPISADSRGRNGLSTIGIFEALQAHHTPLASASDAKPGTIIIAPTEGARHGHIGIVGATTGGVAATQVYSNKSVPGVFKRNYTIGTFTEHYTGPRLHLQVLFFALKRDFFA